MKNNFFLSFKLVSIMVFMCFLSACTSTTYTAPVVDINDKPTERLDSSCVTNVSSQQKAVSNGDMSQHLALAKRAMACIENVDFSPKHPDQKLAMQFNALAFTNYLKAGELSAAKSAFEHFTVKFPQQDLTFEDYSSFVDTATALLNYKELSEYQINTLDISATLRTELIRQKTWAHN